MKGYKATDKDMKCRGFQFELGKWYEHEGELIECQSGFHFCDQPSGPWAYYSEEGTRIFEVEAEGILDESFKPGAEVKRVCRRIKLVREIEIGGDSNTGNSNTGDRNTGDRNTGYCNTGYCNTGYCNTGYCNTGNSNTGDGNATGHSAGFFCVKEPKVISFDEQTKLTHHDFLRLYPEAYNLAEALCGSKPIEFERYKNIPGITARKLKALHKKHMNGRLKP
jgi:hypothetical protein